MAGKLPLDPEEHPVHALVPEPSEAMLRVMRLAVERIGGTILPDTHGGRKTLIREDAERIKTYTYPLTNCDRDNVIAQIPIDPLNPDSKQIRVCLVCDSWQRVLELADL